MPALVHQNPFNAYNIPAVPTWVNGKKYDSKLEASAARIFEQYNIAFTHHVLFECFDRKGNRFNYTIDFVFNVPQKLVGCGLVNCVEVKGVLTKKDIIRLDCLEFTHRMKGYIVLEPLIKLWEAEGLYW